MTQRGEHVQHRRFSDFVKAAPLKGLGVDMDLVERIVGTEDPDLLVLLREAQKVGRGSAGRGRPSLEGSESESSSETSDYLAQRLARDSPEGYDRVKAGELSIYAAAVLAGIRPRRVSVRTDDAASTARSLRKNMAPEAFVALIGELEKLRDER